MEFKSFNFKNSNSNYNKNSKFKFNNNDNNDDNNNKRGHGKNQPEERGRVDEFARSIAYYINLLNKSPVEMQEKLNKTKQVIDSFPEILKYETGLLNLEYNFRQSQKLTMAALRKNNESIEAKLAQNEKWCTLPLQMILDVSKVDPEIYKTSGFVVKKLEKKVNLIDPNFHDPFAVERRLLGRGIVRRANPINKNKMFTYKTGDVGCSTRLTALYMPGKLHFNRPVLDARDKLRKIDLEQKLEEKYGEEWKNEVGMCECEQKEKLCEHMQDCDIINFTHVLYYVKEELINDIISKNKIITATVHIFLEEDFEYDEFYGEDHMLKIVKKGEDVDFTVMNDKNYNHKAIFNYLWETNEITFKNCTINVFQRINHNKMQHINLMITPFENKKPMYDMNFKFRAPIARSNIPEIKEQYTQILAKENEVNFSKSYNSGYVGYLKLVDIDGKEILDEEGKPKVTFCRKLDSDFIFPKVINTNWLDFESITTKSSEESIVIKEEVLVACVRTLTTAKDIPKAFDAIINKIMLSTNSVNSDLIMIIALNILKSFYELQFNINLIKKSDYYKKIIEKQYEKYDTPSWFRPVDKIKDLFFNSQIERKLKLIEPHFKNFRKNMIINNNKVKSVSKQLLEAAKNVNQKFKLELSNNSTEEFKEEKPKIVLQFPKVNGSKEKEKEIKKRNEEFNKIKILGKEVEKSEENKKEEEPMYEVHPSLINLDFKSSEEEVKRILKNIKVEKIGANKMSDKEFNSIIEKFVHNKQKTDIKNMKLEIQPNNLEAGDKKIKKSEQNKAQKNKPEDANNLNNLDSIYKQIKIENSRHQTTIQKINKPFNQIELNKLSPEKLTEVTQYLNKNLFADNNTIPMYLSQDSLVHGLEIEKKSYNLRKYDEEKFFTKEELKKLFETNNYRYIKNNYDMIGDIKNDCIITALAQMLLGEPTIDNFLNMKKEIEKSYFIQGKHYNLLSMAKKTIEVIKPWAQTVKTNLLVVTKQSIDNKKLDMAENNSIILEEKPNKFLVFVSDGNHLDFLEKIASIAEEEEEEYEGEEEEEQEKDSLQDSEADVEQEEFEEDGSVTKNLMEEGEDFDEFYEEEGDEFDEEGNRIEKFGCLEERGMPEGRILRKRCINRQLYQDFIVNLADTSDRFICPMFPELNANTSYEEFCARIPCYCEGPMTYAHTLNDPRRDEKAIFYGQCPRIQIIASLRQLLPQNPPNDKLKHELEKYMDNLFMERNVDELIEKHFSKIDYNRWLQRLKPNYRKKILNYLKRTEDWYTIEEPNIVNGVIKEEAQSEKDKARMIGSPTILHKILMGPIESNFENLFKELFPDFWGVGESLLTKEYEINELIEKYGADKALTLDISGLDQSHNKVAKMFWVKIVEKICGFLEEKNNSAFNPKYIKRMLLKDKTVIVCKNSKNREQMVCAAELKNKMASGQGYTTVLNTSMMCFLCEFIRSKFSLNLSGKISGDDCALLTSNDQKQLSNAFGYVFSKKGANNKGGAGLVMKYFRFGPLQTMSPCSLMCFHCPIHGYKFLRMYDRYLQNFFYSQRMLDIPADLRECFFNMVCIGEQFWSKNYSAFEIINSKKTIDRSKLRELIDYLNKTAKTTTKGLEKMEELAKQLFLNRGFILEGDFWDSTTYALKKELNFIRQEDKHENKRLGEGECCDIYLTLRLAEIDPGFSYLEYNNFEEACQNYQSKLDRLNKKVNFKKIEVDDFDLPTYDQLQELRSLGLGLWQRHIIDYGFIQDQAWRKYLINTEVIGANIRRFKKFLS